MAESGRELRLLIATACRILVREGLVGGWGHVSARLPGGDSLLITPRMSLALVQPDDLVTVDLEGDKLAGARNQPLETHLHTAIYRRRPDAGAVARTHSPYARVLSVLGRPLQAIDQASAALGGEVPVFHPGYHITTRDLGETLADALGDAGAVLLRGNGTAVVGRDVREAVLRSLHLEEAATTFVRALGAGELLTLDPAELAAMRDVMLSATEIGRGWDYYLSRLTPPPSG